MAKFIKHTSCPNCGSSDARALYSDQSSYCFSCDTPFTPPPEDTDMGTEGPEVECKERSMSNLCDTIRYTFTKPYRALEPKLLNSIGVKARYDNKTGEIDAVSWPVYKGGKETGRHVRILPKKFVNCGDVKQAELFLQWKWKEGGQLVIVTGGYEDALSAIQILKGFGRKYRVVSLPSGENIRGVKDNLEWLETFDQVVFCLDNDKVGRETAEKCVKLLTPGKGRVMVLESEGGVKDCNDLLRSGKNREFLEALNNAKDVGGSGIITSSEIRDEVIKGVEEGIPWPWESLTKITHGIRRKELVGIGAGSGSGKSTFIKEMIYHLSHCLGNRVGLFMFEEAPEMTIRHIVGKYINRPIHIPGTKWDDREINKVLDLLEDKIYLYDHVGSIGWEDVKNKIRYMAVSLDIKDIFIDPITALSAMEKDVNKFLEGMMADLRALVQELDITVYFVSHLATPQGDKGHEEGAQVRAAQFRGSRTITFWSNTLIGLERDSQSVDEFVRNQVNVRLLKDRYAGMTGECVTLRYNHETGRLLEDSREEEDF